jgi:transmembrane sensor
MPDRIDWKLLDRYLSGEASDAERETVRVWLDGDPRRADVLETLRTRPMPRDDAAWNVDAAWQRLAPRLDGAPADAAPRVLPFEPARGPARRERWTFAPWRVAAAALLVATGALATWQYARRPTHEPTLGRPIVAQREFVAPNGSRAPITLSDGSRVILAAGSRLRHAGDYGARSRDVWLEGEGYFEVTHDAARPFRVHAGEAVAHDLGTRFVVRAYPELAQVEVLVAEGRVSLRQDRPAADSALLSAGMLGRLERGAAVPTVQQQVDTSAYVGWTRGALVLRGVTLADALPRLERWYDVDLAVGDSALAARRVSASFQDATLDEVLDALTLALGARVTRSGRTITFHATAR